MPTQVPPTAENSDPDQLDVPSGPEPTDAASDPLAEPVEATAAYPQPMIGQPVEAAPVAPDAAQPFAAQPVAPQPVTPQPVTPQPVMPQPVQQAVAEPVTPPAPSFQPPTPQPVAPQPVVTPVNAGAPVAPARIPAYTPPAPAPEAVIPSPAAPPVTNDSIFAPPPSEEERKLAAERAARKEAMMANLSAPAPAEQPKAEKVVVQRRNTDKFLGSLGLFVLRIVLAGILSIRAFTNLSNIAAFTEQLANNTILPYPEIFAYGIGIAEFIIALCLVLGIIVRISSVLLMVLAIGNLALLYWNPAWSPFDNVPAGTGMSFYGELDLLLAAVAFLFFCLGGGGWGIDHSFRASRERDKLEKAGIE
jgi:uncharacterized membrane protein YphA (DoxX/SURF4 family)